VGEGRFAADHQVELLEDGDGIDDVSDVRRKVSHEGKTVIVIQALGFRPNLESI
jgi:hypothetical protein